MSYEWTFDITETNHADVGVGLRSPVLNPVGAFISAPAAMPTRRQGKRIFRPGEFRDLLTEKKWRFCNEIERSVQSLPNTPTGRPPFEPQPSAGCTDHRLDRIGARRDVVP